MEKLDKLKEQIKNLFDKTEDKELVNELSSINSTINDLDIDIQSMDNEHKELLKDYKEVIKHTSFKPKDTNDNRVGETKEPSIDAIVNDIIAKRK